jgi:ABC-type antimicrobial peptide transport system permease subunit
VSENQAQARSVTSHSGRAVVLFVYAVVVGIAGFTGFLLGTVGPSELRPVKLFFLIELPPTPVGLAVYGMGTIGLLLGVLLLGVRHASRRYAA